MIRLGYNTLQFLGHKVYPANLIVAAAVLLHRELFCQQGMVAVVKGVLVVLAMLHLQHESHLKLSECRMAVCILMFH